MISPAHPQRRFNAPPTRTIAAFLIAAVVIPAVITRLPVLITGGLALVLALIILTFANPLYGLILALLLGPFGALEKIVFGNALIDSGQVFLILTFLSWVAMGLAHRRLTIPRSRLNGPIILFILLALLSLLDAYSITNGFVELVKWLEILLIIWLIVDLPAIQTRHSDYYPHVARTLLAALLLAGLSQALIGIWQFGLRGDGPEHFMVLGQFYRAYGTFEQPNPFGGYMNLTTFLALGTTLGFAAAWWKNQEPDGSGYPKRVLARWFFLSGSCALAGVFALIFSWSRGAWLGFLAGIVVLVLFSARRLRRGIVRLLVFGLIGGSLLLVGVATGYGPALSVADRLGGFQEEFTFGDVRGVDINDSNYSVLERLAHWQAAVDMARDDLWTGVGFGNYEVAYESYALINWPDALGHAHNYYLNLLAEVGLPGLIAYSALWIIIILQSLSVMKNLAWPERGIVVGLLAAWVALAVHHLVDKLYVNNIYVHLGVMLGLLQLISLPGGRNIFAKANSTLPEP